MRAPDFLPAEIFKKIIEESERNYPDECCGMVLGSGKSMCVFPVKNLQDQYHARDPVNFPRTARIAYFMDPAALLKIQKELRTTGETILFIYHSHPDHPALFSPEDKKMALLGEEPSYPETEHIVVSVIKGKAVDLKRFAWDAKRKDFLEIR